MRIDCACIHQNNFNIIMGQRHQLWLYLKIYMFRHMEFVCLDICNLTIVGAIEYMLHNAIIGILKVRKPAVYQIWHMKRIYNMTIIGTIAYMIDNAVIAITGTLIQLN